MKSLPPYRYWTIFGAVILVAAASSLVSGSSQYGVFGLVLGVGFIVLGEVERIRGGRIF
jgi:hypothetical protein